MTHFPSAAKILDFTRNLLLYLLPLFFILLLGNAKLIAQEQELSEKGEVEIISIKDGAELYSIDTKFNTQVSNGKISLRNTITSYKKKQNNTAYLKLSSRPVNDRKNRIVNVVLKSNSIQREFVKKVMLEIEKFERRAESLKKITTNALPSHNQFSTAGRFSGCYSLPVHTNYNLSNSIISDWYFSVKSRVQFLRSHFNTHYNNRSLNLFTRVYQVRPPPEKHSKNV